MTLKKYSYHLEKIFYFKSLPEHEQPYLYLEQYLQCLGDPVEMFTGKKVLDLGAGECGYGRLITEKYAPSALFACDLILERMIPAIRSNSRNSIKFVVGDCLLVPFKEFSFDVVFVNGLLAQLPNQLANFSKEIRRVLKPRGKFIAIEPCPWNLVHLYRFFFGDHSQNQYLIREKNLNSFEEAGFDVNVQYFYGKYPYFRNRFVASCMGIQAQVGPSK